MARLWANFPNRMTNETDKVVVIETVWTEITRGEWIDDGIWNNAVTALLRSSLTWMPTIRQMLEACAEADRNRERAEGRDDASVVLAALSGPVSPNSTLHACIASGSWDRTFARVIAGNQQRSAFYQAEWKRTVAEYPLTLPYRVRKSMGMTRAGFALRDFQPHVTAEDIDDVLRRMAAVPAGKQVDGIPGLRGPLEAALSCVLSEYVAEEQDDFVI